MTCGWHRMVNPWCYRFPCWLPCVPKVQWMHVKPGAKLSSLVADPPVFELLPVRTQAWVRVPPESIRIPHVVWALALACWAQCWL